MTIRRAAIRALDRRGGRRLLGALVQHLARKSAPEVRVYFHRGMWVHRQGDVEFVDGPALYYHPSVFPAWAAEAERCLADAADHWLYAYRPQPGDIIMDIGAGNGEDTLAFSRAVGTAGRVIAVEAHPVTFGCLKLFCELNGLSNISPVEAALVDRAGAVAIGREEDWQGNRIDDAGASGSVWAPGVTLDELVEREKVGRIDFLKMNIEGAEAAAVRGMEKTFGITRALCISCHDFRADRGDGEWFRTKAVVQEAVRRAGFRVVSRDDDPWRYVADQVNAVSGEPLRGAV